MKTTSKKSTIIPAAPGFKVLFWEHGKYEQTPIVAWEIIQGEHARPIIAIEYSGDLGEDCAILEPGGRVEQYAEEFASVEEWVDDMNAAEAYLLGDQNASGRARELAFAMPDHNREYVLRWKPKKAWQIALASLQEEPAQ